MKIKMVHLRHKSTSGTPINFAVFDAKPNSMDSASLDSALNELTIKAKASGLKVDQASLVYNQNNQIRFWGSKNLVNFLSTNGVPKWTHTLDM